jgi:hypothetical protein
MPTTAATGSAVAVASAATARTTEVPATKAPSDVSNSATAAAVAAAPADPESAKASRKALDTAFEGRLTEAATQYQALAKSSEQQVYALAARHMQQGSVRVP